jgi:hypothetical protein
VAADQFQGNPMAGLGQHHIPIRFIVYKLQYGKLFDYVSDRRWRQAQPLGQRGGRRSALSLPYFIDGLEIVFHGLCAHFASLKDYLDKANFHNKLY